MSVRHKCFVSYHEADSKEVDTFIEKFDHVFIPKTIGISDDDDFIDSDDRDYVMRRIREKYLTDSTVTIVLIGKCTAKRKYVDWEIASTLRNDPQNKRSGLLGINLRSIENRELSPPRLDDNLGGDDPYAIYKNWYPRIGSTLESWIQDAYERRTSLVPSNTRALFKYNRPCD